MGSVLSYSGLSTKIRAMQSRLVTDEQLEEIVQLPNVPQVTAYLKRTPEYQNIWSGLDENDLHRGQIEKTPEEIHLPEFFKALPLCKSGTANVPVALLEAL